VSNSQIKHIRSGVRGIAWCGRTNHVFAWHFTDLEHAELALAGGSLAVPCKRCLAKARKAEQEVGRE
jgi:hypothetical protein